MRLDFLKERRFVSELMDDFSLAGEELKQTLDSLTNINSYLGNNRAILGALLPIIRRSVEPLTIVDVGCGGADLILSVAHYAASLNKQVQLIGIDGNPNIVAAVSRKTQAHKNIKFITADIIDPSFTLPECDILISSHFMYHFKDEQLIAFLQNAAQVVKYQIIFSELQRSVFAYGGFNLLARFFNFPRIILSDGLKAISRSFRRHELVVVLNRASIGAYSIQWRWAFRYLINVNLS